MTRPDSRTLVIQRERAAERAAPPEVATTPAKAAALTELRRLAPGVALDRQEARLLAALERGPVTTTEARRYLDILHPAGRVMTLRHRRGLDILTIPVMQRTECGAAHRVGQYVLSRNPAHRATT